jgi:CHAT domain-containing protein
VLVAAGPDLKMAKREAAEVGSLYADAQVLGPTQSTVERVLAALPSARIAHAATHAAFQADSPMFSSLRLADADLNVYDIERLGGAPSLIVLSACDSGFTETRQGEELTGLATALLRMGARTVIASIGLVPDSESTGQLMVSFHQHLIAGHTPGRALRLASEAVHDSPGGEIAAANFICIGTG